MVEAERYALQAQRLTPQAAETYLFLALTANHKQQYSNAESLARRGFKLCAESSHEKQLWLVILKAGQQRNNSKTVQSTTSIESFLAFNALFLIKNYEYPPSHMHHVVVLWLNHQDSCLPKQIREFGTSRLNQQNDPILMH